MTQDDTGFVTRDESVCSQPWLNLRRFRNEISPAARPGKVSSLTPGTLMVDTYYGQAFDFDINDELAVYGATEDLPPYRGEENCFGFLRVPYRRIPRIAVKNRQELYAVLQATPRPEGGELLFRGQNREYYLKRPRSTLAALYGDEDALEPSLLPSASRRRVRLETILPEWCAVLQVFLGVVGTVLQQRSDPDLPEFTSGLNRLRSDFDLHLLALSLAQHYGLPSMGLDTTHDIEVALLFALSDFSADPQRPGPVYVSRRPPGSDPSVIYAFVPWERFQLNYLEYVPPGFPSGRPDRQQARFIHTGWGLSRNTCARMLQVAIYLDPAGEFEVHPAPLFFPSPEDDPFGRFIESVRSGWDISEELRNFLGYLYWVESA